MNTIIKDKLVIVGASIERFDFFEFKRTVLRCIITTPGDMPHRRGIQAGQGVYCRSSTQASDIVETA